MAGWRAWSFGESSPVTALKADHESRTTMEINILNRNKMEEERKYQLDNFEHATRHSALTENNR